MASWPGKDDTGRDHCRPQVVNVDAVGMAVMGYDPYAERGTSPFIRATTRSSCGRSQNRNTRPEAYRRIRTFD